MERVPITPRPHLARRLESIGLSFHSWDDYWKEDVCYRFTLAQIETIEAAAEELHGMCVAAARHVVAQGRLEQLGIPEPCWDAIADSLRREEFSVYGRFDLAYDGAGPPKLLEYNADTPTSLLESAVAQWYWLEDCCPNADQFNSLHERLVERWRSLPGAGPVHLASLRDNEEDWVTTTYMQDTVTQAGRAAKYLHIEDIGWDAGREAYVDLEGEAIETLFKLYPWEWMLREEFGAHVAGSGTRFVEPLWKSLLSCKGILPVLWELYPGHPNLLPAYFEPGRLDAFVKKPLYSREGANIELHAGGRVLTGAPGDYGAEGFVYQGAAAMREFGGRYPVIGAWIVGREPAGMCIREDRAPITTNMSNFVPHYFT
jgi:glutathionylspermidine synthase